MAHYLMNGLDDNSLILIEVTRLQGIKDKVYFIVLPPGGNEKVCCNKNISKF